MVITGILLRFGVDYAKLTKSFVSTIIHNYFTECQCCIWVYLWNLSLVLRYIKQGIYKGEETEYSPKAQSLNLLNIICYTQLCPVLNFDI